MLTFVNAGQANSGVHGPVAFISLELHVCVTNVFYNLCVQEQKRAWAEAVYFCAQQVVDFRRLIQSQRAAM